MREFIKGFCEKITNLVSHIKGYLVLSTHEDLPSGSITPKSMTYRDTANLKSIIDVKALLFTIEHDK